jgi:hypothetical protein
MRLPNQSLTTWAGKKQTVIAASSVDNFESFLGHVQPSTERKQAMEDEFEDSGIWREDDASFRKHDPHAMAAHQEGNARNIDRNASGQQSALRMQTEAARAASMENSCTITYMDDDHQDPREKEFNKTPRKASQEWCVGPTSFCQSQVTTSIMQYLLVMKD